MRVSISWGSIRRQCWRAGAGRNADSAERTCAPAQSQGKEASSSFLGPLTWLPDLAERIRKTEAAINLYKAPRVSARDPLALDALGNYRTTRTQTDEVHQWEEEERSWASPRRNVHQATSQSLLAMQSRSRMTWKEMGSQPRSYCSA